MRITGLFVLIVCTMNLVMAIKDDELADFYNSELELDMDVHKDRIDSDNGSKLGEACSEFADSQYTTAIEAFGQCQLICQEAHFSDGRHPEPPTESGRTEMGICCCRH